MTTSENARDVMVESVDLRKLNVAWFGVWDPRLETMHGAQTSSARSDLFDERSKPRSEDRAARLLARNRQPFREKVAHHEDLSDKYAVFPTCPQASNRSPIPPTS